jgi:cobalt-zinc-cadmium efflux system protein
MSIDEVTKTIRDVEGVRDVHHLNLWTICSHILALSAHIDIVPSFKGKQAGVLRAIEEMLMGKYHISHTTLQVECTMCIEAPVIKELRHRPRHPHDHLSGHGANGHDHDSIHDHHH